MTGIKRPDGEIDGEATRWAENVLGARIEPRQDVGEDDRGESDLEAHLREETSRGWVLPDMRASHGVTRNRGLEIRGRDDDGSTFERW